MTNAQATRTITLSNAELDAVLAGLKLLQRALGRGNGFPPGIREIYTKHGPGLTSVRINALCERITLSG